MAISTSSSFAETKLLRGDRAEWLDLDGKGPYVEERTNRSLKVALGQQNEEHIWLLTPAGAKLDINLGGDAEVGLVIGDGKVVRSNQWRGIVTPTEASVETPGHGAWEEFDGPLVVVQYKEPLSADRSLLSEEDWEELEALGYVQ